MKTYRRPPVGVEKLFCSVVDSKRMQGGLFQIINYQSVSYTHLTLPTKA